MKKLFKYLAVPFIALAFAFIFSLSVTTDSKAYMVNWGHCDPMDFGTMQCAGGEDVEYDGFVKVTVTSSDVENVFNIPITGSYHDELYGYNNLYNSNSKGEMIEGKKYFIKVDKFVTESEYYTEIANIVNNGGILYEGESVPNDKKIETILYFLKDIFEYGNELTCETDYFYSDVARRCVHKDDIAIPNKYIITDFDVRELQVWSEGNYKWTHDSKTRDTILFNLPKDIEWAVKSINSITVIYNTCENVTDGKCDEVSEKKTVTYYDDGTVTITRYDSKKKIDVISNMGLTQELAAVEAAHPNALDSSNKYNRLFKAVKASNLAEAYRHYLVLNVDDTKYIEMIQVDCTLINGQTSVGETEGSVVSDEATEVTTLALIASIFKYLGIAVIAILVVVIAVLILKPIGNVISDASASRKEKSIAKSRKNNNNKR